MRVTLHPPVSGWSSFDTDQWELFNLREDRAKSRNVAADTSDVPESVAVNVRRR